MSRKVNAAMSTWDTHANLVNIQTTCEYCRTLIEINTLFYLYFYSFKSSIFIVSSKFIVIECNYTFVFEVMSTKFTLKAFVCYLLYWDNISIYRILFNDCFFYGLIIYNR